MQDLLVCLVIEEVAYEEGSLLLLSLFLSLLDNFSALLFHDLICLQVFLVLIALEVFGLRFECLIVREVSLATRHNHEIFPVFDDNDDKDDKLDGADGCERSNCIGFLPTVLINEPLLVLNDEKCREGGHNHRDRAHKDLVLKLL